MKRANAILLWAPVLLTVSLSATAAEFEGRLQWLQRVELGTLVSGIVESVRVVPGDRVKKGDLLVSLEQPVLKAAVEEAEAELALREATLAEAERELERTQELYDRTLLSNHDLELGKIAFAEAQAAYGKAKAQLAASRERLRHSAVRAPFDGVVLNRSVEPGQTVITRLQSVPLVVVGGTDRLLVRLSVPGSELKGLRRGASVGVRVDGRRFEGEIYHVGYEPLPGGNAYPVDVVFAPEREMSPRVGQMATVELP